MSTCVPYHNDREIQNVPEISQIGIRMENKPIGDYFKHSFNGKDNEKDKFGSFL